MERSQYFRGMSFFFSPSRICYALRVGASIGKSLFREKEEEEEATFLDPPKMTKRFQSIRSGSNPPKEGRMALHHSPSDSSEDEDEDEDDDVSSAKANWNGICRI